MTKSDEKNNLHADSNQKPLTQLSCLTALRIVIK